MFALTNKPDMAARLYQGLIALASEEGKGTDAMRLIQHIAGVLVETYFVFENPDETMLASFDKLSGLMGCVPAQGDLATNALPPPHIIDMETERGRAAARIFFEDWLDCEYEFHDLMLVIIHNIFVSWEDEGLHRAESLRLLVECTTRCMGFEIAAQELCDVVIDKKVAGEQWSLNECIASLSAVAGRRMAMLLSADCCQMFSGADVPDDLDQVIYVMSQEAVRLGLPVSSEWRFGLPANDRPINAPVELVIGIEPYCKSFFRAIQMDDKHEQAVCCAKAAGRMVAVAAGGEDPEMEPALAKPLALSAMTESYKSVCVQHVLMAR